MANKKKLDDMLDELQEKVGSFYAGMHDLDNEQKQKREAMLESGLAKVREYLGAEGMVEVETKLKELEPKVKTVQHRQLNSLEPVPSVEWQDAERYHILKKLRGS